MGIVSRREFIGIGRGSRGRGQKIGPERRDSDDGKRFQAMDVVLALLLGENLLELGGGPGGGGHKNRPDRRDSDLFVPLENDVSPAWELHLAHY